MFCDWDLFDDGLDLEDLALFGGLCGLIEEEIEERRCNQFEEEGYMDDEEDE